MGGYGSGRWLMGNGVNIGWKGSGNNNLNVTEERVIDDGSGQFIDVFEDSTKFISDQTSPYRPALCNGQWPNFTIYYAWTGEGDGELNIMHCDNTDPFTDMPPTTFDSSTKVTISGETSPSAPAIEVLGKGLYLCWRGEDNHINVLGMDLGSQDRNKQTSGETTPYHFAIAAYRGSLFVAWTGEGDGQLNIAQMSPVYDPTTP